MNRWLFLNIILCICFKEAITSPYKSSRCIIQYEEKCKKPCDCTQETSENSFYKLYRAIVKVAEKRCECDALCERTIKTECGHGVCDEGTRSCKCNPCWKGKTCQTYANPNAPIFEQDKYSHFIPTSARIGTVLTKVKAFDKDGKHCESKQNCPCGEIEYHLNEKKSNYAPFYVNLTSGEIIVDGHLLQPKYILHIEATNIDNEIVNGQDMVAYSSATITVTVTGMNKPVMNQAVSKHSRRRRAAATDNHSLVFVLIPHITTTFYFERGESILFDGSFYHNITYKAVGPISFECKSDNLEMLTTDFKFLSSTTTNTNSEAPHIESNKLKFTISGLAEPETITIEMMTTVKSDIVALASLYVKCTLLSTLNPSGDRIKYDVFSTPVVYGVYPTVTFTRPTQERIGTYDPPTVFSTVICFPSIDMYALLEITANIEDYQFMTVDNAVLVDTGALTFEEAGTAEYFTSEPFFGHDRIVYNFGFVQAPDPNDQCLTLNFSLTVKDHHLLEDGSTHWIGIGMQSGNRVLWVEQTSVEVIKVEPALNMSVSSPSMSESSTVFIDDEVEINYLISHASNSKQAAANLILIMSVTYFEPTPESASTALNTINETHYKVTDVQNKPLPENDILQGSINLKVGQDVIPLGTAVVKFTLSYENGGGDKKLPLEESITPLIGTPSFLLTLNGSNEMMPAEQRQITLEIMITKLSTPVQIELLSQSENDRPIFSIHDVQILNIGTNLQKVNQNPKPSYNSTDPNSKINDIVTIDFGTVLNIHDNTSDTMANKIQLSFMITMNCHSNMTVNNTRYWIGAGMHGGDEMIWVGQISIFGFLPSDHRPWLDLEWNANPEILPLSPGNKLSMSFGISHSPMSSCFAYNVSLNVMLPSFVEHDTSVDLNSVNYVYNEHRATFKYMQEFSFFDKTLTSENKMFAVISNDKFQQEGDFNLSIAIIMTYYDESGQDYNMMKIYNAPVSIPVAVTLSPTPLPTFGKAEFYPQGIAWDHNDNPTAVHICVGKKAIHLPACYTTDKTGAYIQRGSMMLGCIIGTDGAYNLYGVSHDKRAYIKYNKRRNRWTSISSQDYQDVKASLAPSYMIRDPNIPDGPPVSGVNQLKTLPGGVWALTGSGVYFASGTLAGNVESMPWELKATWECTIQGCY